VHELEGGLIQKLYQKPKIAFGRVEIKSGEWCKFTVSLNLNAELFDDNQKLMEGFRNSDELTRRGNKVSV
jgi:hypothetical protein